MNIQNCNFNLSDENVCCILGNRLREAREFIGLSQQKVADSLCLKLFIIRSIEEGYADTLKITSIFLYGYIRSYARLVGVDDKEVLILSSNKLFSSHSLSKQKKSSVFFIFKKYLSKKYLKNIRLLIIVFMIFNIIIFNIWYFLYYLSLQERYFNSDNIYLMKNITSYKWDKECLSLFFESHVLSTRKIDIFCLDNYIGESLFFLYSIFPDIVLNRFLDAIENFDLYEHKLFYQNSDIISNVNYINKNLLVINFTGDCWIEVMDANGKILCIGTQRAGYVVNLIGEVPYKVVVGVPECTKIKYQGNIVNLNEFISPYKIARLTIPF